MAIDQVKGPSDEYMKKISSIHNGMHEIEFKKKKFTRLKTIKFKKEEDILDNDLGDHYYLKDLESWNVFDVIRYNKEELQDIVKDFLNAHTLLKLEERIQAIKTSSKLIEAHKFPL